MPADKGFTLLVFVLVAVVGAVAAQEVAVGAMVYGNLFALLMVIGVRDSEGRVDRLCLNNAGLATVGCLLLLGVARLFSGRLAELIVAGLLLVYVWAVKGILRRCRAGS